MFVNVSINMTIPIAMTGYCGLMKQTSYIVMLSDNNTDRRAWFVIPVVSVLLVGWKVYLKLTLAFPVTPISDPPPPRCEHLLHTLGRL